MKFHENVPQTVVAHWRDTKIVCDSCGKESYTKDRWDTGYDFSEINVSAEIGQIYPEGDCRKGYVIDLCPDCFTDKLMPLVAEHMGIEFREYDADEGEPREDAAGRMTGLLRRSWETLT